MYGERERSYLSLFGGRYGMGVELQIWQLVEWTGMETGTHNIVTFSESYHIVQKVVPVISALASGAVLETSGAQVVQAYVNIDM